MTASSDSSDLNSVFFNDTSRALNDDEREEFITRIWDTRKSTIRESSQPFSISWRMNGRQRRNKDSSSPSRTFSPSETFSANIPKKAGLKYLERSEARILHSFRGNLSGKPPY